MERVSLKKIKDIPFSGQTLEMSYDNNMVTHFKGEGDNAFAFSLGYAHGKERGLQVALLQTIIRGKLSEWIKNDPETIETDRFMLKMGFYYQARKEVIHLKEKDREFLESYCEGLNKSRKVNTPWEVKLFPYPKKPWQPADSIALMKVMAYLGLAQTQQDFEKFLAMSLAQGISPTYFKSLLPGIDQEGLEDLILCLQKTNFDHSPIPQNEYLMGLPKLKNSNNWVVANKLSETNTPLMAADPHLEINRLPSLWFEFVWNQRDNYKTGITMPGVPGFIMGRNKNLSFSFTYGYMDTIDYFVEEIKDGKLKEEDNWVGLSCREEVISPLKGPNDKVRVYESEKGPLEVPETCILNNNLLKDGYYLTRSWSGHTSGGAEAIECLRLLSNCSKTQEACEIVKNLFMSANWLFADNEGSIGYQQSGYLPDRSHQGLYPQAGWDRQKAWKKGHKKENLLQNLNPECGYLITANNDVFKEFLGKQNSMSINLPLADYRYQRILKQIQSKGKTSVVKCKTLQNDVYSEQASLFMEVLKPIIPDTPSGRILSQWDFKYDKESRGAFLFEKFLSNCYEGLIAPVWGPQAWQTMRANTTLLTDYYGLFDRILLNPEHQDSLWFDSSINDQDMDIDVLKLRNEFIKVCLDKTLTLFPMAKCEKWGDVNTFMFSHILFGKNTPSWFPCNEGPHFLKGCRATVHQGNIYRDRGTLSSFGPSYRMVTDMGNNCVFSSIPGGPSDRMFKKSYKSEIPNWLGGHYKTLLPY